jgi:electron transport complex protein RnfB
MKHDGDYPAAHADAIDRLLPQTQCTRCGYAGCRPYAEALAAGETDLNRCPPGGEAGIAKLAALLGREAKPLDPECGREQPLHAAQVEEEHCIGCTLCIQACPVDAIVGAPRLMHTVIGELCTGCELCIPPCPVDCIVMVPASREWPEWTGARAVAAKARFESRKTRLAQEEKEQSARLARRAAAARSAAGADVRRAAIEAALARARAAKKAGATHR